MGSFFYYIRYYLRYKTWFWFILFLVFESGALSKYFHLIKTSYHSHLWEVILNAVTGLVCLGIFLRLVSRRQTEDTSNNLKNGRLVILFTVLGAFSGAAILPYYIDTLGTQKLEQQLHLPFVGVVAATVFSTAAMTLIVSSIGLGLAEKVGLDVPLLRRWLYEGKFSKVSRKWIVISILGSFVGTFVMAVLETYVFQPNLPQLPTTPKVSLWANLLTIFYGGIVEEVLLRLFLMTLIVWMFSRFQKLKNKISDLIYWTAIILSSVLFGLGHLPAIASLFGGLTPLLVIRAIIVNGFLGLLFGYLYWKKGLEYAILSHMSGDLFLHVILVPLFSV